MRKILVSLALLLFPLSICHAASLSIDQKVWDGILKSNVDKNGFVDYAGIRINRGGDLYRYLTLLEEADVKSMTEEDKIVFWINAYNAHVVKYILAKPNMEKISEDPAFFDKKFKIARYNLSLNDIRNRILRSDPVAPGLSVKDYSPSILFGLCDGTMAAPKLDNHAFFTAGYHERLRADAIDFLNDPKNIRVENGKLMMSSVLQTYAKDFDSVGGVAVFVTSLLDPTLRTDVTDLKTAFAQFPGNAVYQYDWTVNQIKNKK